MKKVHFQRRGIASRYRKKTAPMKKVWPLRREYAAPLSTRWKPKKRRELRPVPRRIRAPRTALSTHRYAVVRRAVRVSTNRATSSLACPSRGPTAALASQLPQVRPHASSHKWIGSQNTMCDVAWRGRKNVPPRYCIVLLCRPNTHHPAHTQKLIRLMFFVMVAMRHRPSLTYLPFLSLSRSYPSETGTYLSQPCISIPLRRVSFSPIPTHPSQW